MCRKNIEIFQEMVKEKIINGDLHIENASSGQS